MDEMNASDFKTRCLAILDEIHQKGISITILKRGKPVAQIGPVVAKGEGEFPQDSLIGSVKTTGDIINPVISDSELDLESDLL